MVTHDSIRTENQSIVYAVVYLSAALIRMGLCFSSHAIVSERSSED